jgi:hypothetical protein
MLVYQPVVSSPAPSNWKQKSPSTLLGLGLAASEFAADQMTQQYLVGQFSALLGDLERTAAAWQPVVHDLRREVESSPVAIASRVCGRGHGADRHDLLGCPSPRGCHPVSQLREGGRRAGRVHRECRSLALDEGSRLGVDRRAFRSRGGVVVQSRRRRRLRRDACGSNRA